MNDDVVLDVTEIAGQVYGLYIAMIQQLYSYYHTCFYL